MSRFVQWLRLHAFKRQISLKPIESLDTLSQINKELAQKTDRNIYVATSSENYIPVTFGVIKPVILLPESLMKSPEKMNLAVRHELTHIQQQDFGTHLVISAIQSLFWFHPLVHVLSNQIVEYREMRCDSIIISDRSVSKKRVCLPTSRTYAHAQSQSKNIS